MANVDNLTSWKAGQSGNPTGKPKGTLNRSTVLKRYLGAKMKSNPEDIPVELEGKITVEDAIALALIKKALSGDVAAIREVQDTVHGKITDTSEVQHSYTKMESVMISDEDGEMKALEFDVGSKPRPII